jgi:hypothetical protein
MVIEEDRKAAEFLDRVAVLGGPAAIIASFTFIKDIAPNPPAFALAALFLAWLLFIGGSGCGLMAQRSKRKTAGAYQDLLDRKIAAGDPVFREGEYGSVRPLNQTTGDWSNRALILVVAGVACMVIFAGANFLGSSLGKKSPVSSASTSGATQPSSTDSSFLRLVLTACQEAECVIIYRTPTRAPAIAAGAKPDSVAAKSSNPARSTTETGQQRARGRTEAGPAPKGAL